MPPALAIPVKLDMNSLKQQSSEAQSHVAQTLRVIGQGFTRLNTEIVAGSAGAGAAVATGWGQSAAAIALRFTALGVTAVGAFKLISAAVDHTRKQLEEMVEIADKATKANVSPQFFQSFLSESRKLKVESADLEVALTNAFDNLKDKLVENIKPWEDWDQASLRAISSVQAQMEKFELQFFGQQGSRGFDLFQNAGTQEEKLAAAVTMMRELEQSGQRLAALDLAEKVFGSKIADAIRQGRLEFQSLEENVTRIAEKTRDAFSNEMVTRAKEVDDKLKIAHQTLERELKPTWESLQVIVLEIRDAWAQVVDLTAQAVKVANQIDVGAALRAALPGLSLLEILRRARSATTPDIGPDPNAGIPVSATRTLPRSGSLRPDPEAPAAGRDRFDAAADAISRRTAALTAETAAIDLGTAAREKARIQAELLTVAEQVYGTVTDEHRAKIEALATAYGEAAARIENARSPLAQFARDSANIGKQLNQFAASSLDTVTNELANVVTGTKSASEAFRNMANSIIQDLARIAIRQAITGPIAGGLSSLFGGGLTGGGLAFGGMNGLPVFIGANAGGTDNWRGGPTWVGENGPEIVNLPRGSQIVPNHLIGRGGMNVTLGGSSIVIEGNASDDTVERLASMLAEDQRTRKDQFRSFMAESQTRSQLAS